jgi:hypothetical protein
MIKKIKTLGPAVEISILTVDIDPDTKYSPFMEQFAHVYQFDE